MRVRHLHNQDSQRPGWGASPRDLGQLLPVVSRPKIVAPLLYHALLEGALSNVTWLPTGTSAPTKVRTSAAIVQPTATSWPLTKPQQLFRSPGSSN
jgi:hypothetical protein